MLTLKVCYFARVYATAVIMLSTNATSIPNQDYNCLPYSCVTELIALPPMNNLKEILRRSFEERHPIDPNLWLVGLASDQGLEEVIKLCFYFNINLLYLGARYRIELTVGFG